MCTGLVHNVHALDRRGDWSRNHTYCSCIFVCLSAQNICEWQNTSLFYFQELFSLCKTSSTSPSYRYVMYHTSYNVVMVFTIVCFCLQWSWQFNQAIDHICHVYWCNNRMLGEQFRKVVNHKSMASNLQAFPVFA